jgi:hypothetical protein
MSGDAKPKKPTLDKVSIDDEIIFDEDQLINDLTGLMNSTLQIQKTMVGGVSGASAPQTKNEKSELIYISDAPGGVASLEENTNDGSGTSSAKPETSARPTAPASKVSVPSEDLLISQFLKTGKFYDGTGALPALTDSSDYVIFDLSRDDHRSFGVSSTEYHYLTTRPLLKHKMLKLVIDITREDLKNISENGFTMTVDTIMTKYLNCLNNEARLKSYDVVHLLDTPKELLRHIRSTFTIYEHINKISIPVLIETPKIEHLIDINVAVSQDGITMNVNTKELLKLYKVSTDGSLSFIAFFACVYKKCKSLKANVIPAPADLLAAYIRVMSGISTNGLYVKCMLPDHLRDSRLDAGHREFTVTNKGGWVSYYGDKIRRGRNCPFLKKSYLLLDERANKNAAYIGRVDRLRRFINAQVATENMVGLCPLSDSRVAAACVLPPVMTHAVASQFKIIDPVASGSPISHIPLAPLAEDIDIENSLLNLAVSADRTTVTIESLNQPLIKMRREFDSKHQFTHDDVAEAVAKYGIKYGFEKYGPVASDVVKAMNGSNIPLAGQLIARLERTSADVKRLLRDTLVFNVQNGDRVSRGTVVCSQKIDEGIKDIFGCAAGDAPCLNMMEGLTYENGRYVATADGGFWRSATGSNIGVSNTIIFDGLVTQKIWNERVGVSKSGHPLDVKCSVVVNGSMQDLSMIHIQGNLQVGGSINNCSIVISGDLTVRGGGITLGGKTVTAKGVIDSEFIQGYSAVDLQQKKNQMPFGTIGAKEIHTGCFLGCIAFADNVEVKKRTSSSYFGVSGGTIINSQIYATDRIQTLNIGGNIDAQNVFLGVGIPMKAKERMVKYIDRFRRVDALIQNEKNFLHNQYKLKSPRSLDMQEKIARSEKILAKGLRLRRALKNKALLASAEARQAANKNGVIIIQGQAKVGAQFQIGLLPIKIVTVINRDSFFSVVLKNEGGALAAVRKNYG